MYDMSNDLTSPEKITEDKIEVSLNTTGAGGVTQLEGLSASIVDSTVVLKVPNETKLCVFRMFKKDELGTTINNSDKNGAPNFINIVFALKFKSKNICLQFKPH